MIPLPQVSISAGQGTYSQEAQSGTQQRQLITGAKTSVMTSRSRLWEVIVSALLFIEWIFHVARRISLKAEQDKDGGWVEEADDDEIDM